MSTSKTPTKLPRNFSSPFDIVLKNSDPRQLIAPEVLIIPPFDIVLKNSDPRQLIAPEVLIIPIPLPSYVANSPPAVLIIPLPSP
ncbi:MAG: hypothetical protein E6K97_10885 [Thaumarchaeota archaeon]|nr:MAG: hypothetical protein E6K97_10885 [Nitrososphaerota archaeon]